MSAGSSKRKRDDSTVDRPPKVRAVEDDGKPQTPLNSKSRGQSRQAKSERRSKKNLKNRSALSRSNKFNARSGEQPELLAPSCGQANDDSLATGEDFVSISVDSAPVPPLSLSPPHDALARQAQPKIKPKASSETPRLTPTTDSESKKDRFILFIGNLPYTATTPSITAHFIAVQPFTIRHNTDKQTGRSKGFAFLEFENYDKMKACLKLYHHSIFDPDNQKAEIKGEDQQQGRKMDTRIPKAAGDEKKGGPNPKNARRINVELTAGGGGKSKQRKEKIQMKNRKLAGQRERRYIKEAAEKAKTGQERKERPATGANADGGSADHRGNIHPSRLKRVQH